MTPHVSDSPKKRLFRWSVWLHKWAGLLLGLQVLFWIAGGLIMSAIPLDKVHGKHLANGKIAAKKTESNTLEEHQFALDSLLREHGDTLKQVELSYRLTRPIYILTFAQSTLILDGITGEPLGDLTQTNIEQLALQYYLGDGKLAKLERLSTPPHEASRAKNAIWRADFDDIEATSLYIQPDTGDLLHVRSHIWRLFDFVWMLHIMDYDTRDDFNNPLLIGFAAAALLFTFSGFVLLYRSFAPALRARFKNAT